jgi:Predicted xylanase/chitin deacetylase
MYHSISRQPGKLHLSPELLEEQCRCLKEHGWRGISLAEAEDCLVRGKRLPRKACLLSFDDGYLDNYVYAEPILRAYGHCGVIFPVLKLVARHRDLLPNAEDLAEHPEREAELGDVHSPRNVLRSGYRVRDIRFCGWNELRRMRERGVMEPVPHSLDHSRVVSSLNFTDFYKRQGTWGYFAVTPYRPPWGMPLFPTDYSLATRAYIPSEALFALVRDMVPQNQREARAFLGNQAHRSALERAVRALPSLGRQETEEEFRARLFAEFTICREQFSARFGVEPLSFCWPWGAYCQESIEEAERAGFRLLFCTSQTAGRYRQARPVLRVGVRFHTTPEMVLRKVRLFSWKPVAVAYEQQIRLFSQGAPWSKIRT